MLERTLRLAATAKENRVGRLVRENAHSVGSFLWSMPRSRSYPILGAVGALGAPLGLLCGRALAGGQVPTFAWAWHEITYLPVTYAYVTLSTVAVLAVLGTLLGRWFDHVRLLSVTDPLTGLFNRRQFGQRLAEEVRRVHRHPGRSTSVLCVDIDRLKLINDGFGHRAGDQALVAVGRTLLKNTRAVDAVARVGGDEFAVLLPETSAAQASAISERVGAELARCTSPSTGRLAVSIGVAELSMADLESDDVLVAADAALYRAKAAGGGHAAIAQPDAARGWHGRHFTLTEATLLLAERGAYR